MKKEKFQVIEYIRILILRVDKYLSNFPKSELEIKNKLRNNTFDLLELSYEANETESKDKKIELISRLIAKVKTIDFLLNLSYDKKLITSKKYLKLGELLDAITKRATGWKKAMISHNLNQNENVELDVAELKNNKDEIIPIKNINNNKFVNQAKLNKDFLPFSKITHLMD